MAFCGANSKLLWLPRIWGRFDGAFLAASVKHSDDSEWVHVHACVDWVEHAIATGGEAYLRTPDHDLPFYARHMLDVWAVTLGAAAVLLSAVQLAIPKIAAAVKSKIIIGSSCSNAAKKAA